MFTGIVEELGVVRSMQDHRLVVDCTTVTADSDVGASVAVNGVCLTVVERSDSGLSFDVSDETFARSSLQRLTTGARVNLERPVTLAARLGGHIVQGHVDGVGAVGDIVPDEAGGARLKVILPRELMRYVVQKGSLTVDGVSLTVAELGETYVTVALIPHTLAATTLGAVRGGDPLNLEVDVFARYVERLMEGADA
jgi:riboflavin synthase